MAIRDKLIQRMFFKSMLEDNMGTGADKDIKALIAEIDK